MTSRGPDTKNPEADHDAWRRSRRDKKLTVEWGDHQAEALWNGVYARWDPAIDGRTVLDLGCHWGYLLKYLLDEHDPERLIGVDISPAWTKVTEWDWKARSDVLEFHHGDLSSVAVENASVDLMLSTGTLQSMTPEQLDASLARAYALLRPGGEFMLRTHLYTSHRCGVLHHLYERPYVHMFYGQRELESHLEAEGQGPPGYFNWMTASSYLGAFARAGFEIIDVYRRPNWHAVEVQEQVAETFPVSDEELNVAHLEARLLRPADADDLTRLEAARLSLNTGSRMAGPE